MIRYLTEQFPILVGPPWMHNRTQPIAIQNVLDYLVAALENPDAVGKFMKLAVRMCSPMLRHYSCLCAFAGIETHGSLPIARDLR